MKNIYIDKIGNKKLPLVYDKKVNYKGYDVYISRDAKFKDAYDSQVFKKKEFFRSNPYTFKKDNEETYKFQIDRKEQIDKLNK